MYNLQEKRDMQLCPTQSINWNYSQNWIQALPNYIHTKAKASLRKESNIYWRIGGLYPLMSIKDFYLILIYWNISHLQIISSFGTNDLETFGFNVWIQALMKKTKRSSPINMIGLFLFCFDFLFLFWFFVFVLIFLLLFWFFCFCCDSGHNIDRNHSIGFWKFCLG